MKRLYSKPECRVTPMTLVQRMLAVSWTETPEGGVESEAYEEGVTI